MTEVEYRRRFSPRTASLSAAIAYLHAWATELHDAARLGARTAGEKASHLDEVLTALEFGYMDMDGTLHDRSVACWCNPTPCTTCGEGHVHLQGVYGGMAKACDNTTCANG